MDGRKMEIAPDWLTWESEKTNWLTLLISRPKGGMTRQNIILILFFFLRRAISPFFQTCCLIPGDRVALSSYPFCWLNYRPVILEWVVTRFPWHRVFFSRIKTFVPQVKRERESFDHRAINFIGYGTAIERRPEYQSVLNFPHLLFLFAHLSYKK